MWPSVALLVPAALGAQTLTVSIPPNIVLPNYGRIPIGQREALEGGAFVARTDDVAANWYNPAGLVRSRGSAINTSATTYEWTNLSVEGLGATAGRSRVSTIGSLFAAVIGQPIIKNDKVRFGFSMTRPVAWRPSGLDARATASQNGGTQQIDYAADVELSTYVPSIAVGYAPGGGQRGTLRLGVGLGLWWTELSQAQTITGRGIAPADVGLLSRSYSAEGTAIRAVLIGGAQWDVRPNVVVGTRVVAPGPSLRGSTRLTYEATASTSASRAELSFRDPEADFNYGVPLEVDGGVAVRAGRVELEVDVRYYGPVGSYELYSSDSTGVLIQAPVAGNPTVSQVPFTAPRHSARSVVSVAAGSSYLVRHGLRVHAGFTTDPSPVEGGSDSPFREVDMFVATAGVSLTGTTISGSIGLGFSTGEGARQVPDPAGGGVPLQTQLRVQSLNLLYALTYSF